MNINIVAIGKIKEQFTKDTLTEYKKRLSPFCNFSITEIQAEQILDEALAKKYMEFEADKILAAIKKNSYIITLEIKGKMLSSEEFALKLKETANEGINDLTFIIGGANGLSERVSRIANFKLSFSKMTFTHQMIRILLAEQIYRAFKINSNEPYHR